MAVDAVGWEQSDYLRPAGNFRGEDRRFALALQREDSADSFLYAGFYRARGALTCADRAVYGLRGQMQREQTSPRLQAAQSRAQAAENAKRSKPATTQVCSQPKQPARVFRANKRLFRVACASAPIIRHLKYPVANRAAKGVRKTLPWYRIRADICGTTVSCLIFRGRAFLAGKRAIARGDPA